ncbi:MAG: hypothetical protein ACJAVO_001361 [Parvibaculaceae bacterium]|jgi:hypothetical protein
MGINLLASLSMLKSSTRAALFGSTALVASVSGAHAIDYIVNAEETSTFTLGLGPADSLTLNGVGEINSVSPGVAVIDLADSITVEDTVVGPGAIEIDADGVGIEVQGLTADLTGGISIAADAMVAATNLGGNEGTGILVHSGGDISGGVNNSGAITGFDYGIVMASGGSISGGLNNTASGTIYGEETAVLLTAGGTTSQTLGGITNAGTIGINAAGTLVADVAIGVTGPAADVTGLIDNDGIILGGDTSILVVGGDISGGIDNSGVIGANDVIVAVPTVVGTVGIRVGEDGDISGGIINSGTIIGADTAIDVDSGSITGGITNSGNIIGGTSVGDAAIYVSDGTLGSTANVGIVNQAGGVISGETAIEINSNSTVYGITNSGEIFGTAGTDVAIGATDSQFNGDITNTAGGVIGANAEGSSGDAVGIGFVNTDSTGGISNSGDIIGSNIGIALMSGSNLAGAITNATTTSTIGLFAGSISNVSAATGIFVNSNSSVAGGIINSGNIEGTVSGIKLYDGSSLGTAATGSAPAIAGIVNNASATINGGSIGIDIDQASVLGGISNAGDIVGVTNGIAIHNDGGGTATATVAGITNASGGVIAAVSTAILVDDGSQVTGAIANAGTIGNTTAGGGLAVRGLLVAGVSTDVSGGVNNTGTIKGSNAAIEVQTSAAISGGIANSSLIGDVAGSVDGIHVNGGSVGSTTGTGISNTGTGVIAGSNAGILINTGGTVLGGISNATSATITGGVTGINVSTGTVSGGIDNDGVITGGTIGLHVQGTLAVINGAVDNSGMISGGATGINVNTSGAELAGGLINSGTILAATYGVNVESGGDINGITNSGFIGANSAGTLFATTGIRVHGGSSDISGTVTNTGMIVGSVDGIVVTGAGSITGGIANGIGGGIVGQSGSAIQIDAGATVGSTAGTGISNATSGVIQGTDVAINVLGSVLGGITNSGTVRATTGSAIVVRSGASVTGGIANNGGLITATNAGTGILVASGSSVTGGISNSGQIVGDSLRGIAINAGSSVTGNIANAVSATISGSTGIYVSSATLNGSIVNTGNIAGDAEGILLRAASSVTGTITNNDDALIFGDDYAIQVRSGSGVTGGIVNAGRISTATDTGTAILVTSGGTVGSITNSGTIRGGTSTSGYGIFVSTGASVTSVTNSGTIEGETGSIQFGNSDSTLTLQTGSNLIGGADGGAGVNDTLVLEGAGSENEVFTAFEHLTVSASTSGTWALSGNSSVEDITVNSGTLDIQGTFAATTATVAGGTLNVSSTGVLTASTIAATGDLDVEGTIVSTGGVVVDGIVSGSGTISGALTVNGILSPGNSPGQLNVVGPLIEANNSSYLVEHEVGATPETDITVVTGTATIGTNVDVNVSVGAGTDGFADNILTATGGITGTYDDVTGLDDNVVGLVAYPDANTATLLVAKTDALVATTATVSDAGFVFLDNLQEGARRDGRVWATGYLYNAENEGLGTNGSDYDQDAFGFNAGVDVISEADLKVGVALGYIDGDIDIDSSTSEAENDGIFGAAYLNYMNDNFYLDGAVMVGQQTVDTTRTLSAGTATASVDATSYGANLEAGLELAALGGRLSPFVKVGIHSASLDSYAEAGAAGAMTVDEVETQQMRLGGGFRYAVDLGSEDGIQVTPAIKVGMTQEWNDTDSTANVGFVGYTGSTTASLDFEDQTTVDLGLSFDVKLSEAVTAFVGWDAALGDETTRNTGTIGVSVNW